MAVEVRQPQVGELIRPTEPPGLNVMDVQILVIVDGFPAPEAFPLLALGQGPLPPVEFIMTPGISPFPILV